MGKSIIIIGAGIAGPSAGCYAQMNDYRTRIFEMHDKPGGLCTSWKRRGYTFDGCIHRLLGSAPDQPFHRIWEELGALQERHIIDHEVLIRIESGNGKTLIVYTDIDRLVRHMEGLAPDDTELIEEMAQAVRRFARFDVTVYKPRELMHLSDGLRLDGGTMSLAGYLVRWGRTSAREFAARFQDPFLRRTLPLMFQWPDAPMVALLGELASQHNHNGGYPIGGSLAFARAIERRYLDLGGKVHYRSRVAEILVEHSRAGSGEYSRAGSGEHSRAVGVRLADGKEHHADIVISAADGHATLFSMLEGKYLSAELRRWYEETPVVPGAVQVSLGLSCDLSAEPHALLILLDSPLEVTGRACEWLGVEHYGFDPTMAPAGKSVLLAKLGADYEYWKRLHADRGRYEAAKQEVAGAVIALLEKRFPGLSQQIDILDVATPVTTERYTGNWQGSPIG